MPFSYSVNFSMMWSCYVWVQAPKHNAFCKPNLSPHNEICGVLTEFAMASPGPGEAKVNQGLPWQALDQRDQSIPEFAVASPGPGGTKV